MYRYLIIECKHDQRLDDEVISLLGEIITYSKVDKDGYQAILYFQHEIDPSFEDVVLNMMSDTLSDLRVYVSHSITHEKDIDQHVAFMKQLINQIPFSKYYYLDNQTIVKHFIYQLSDEMKRFFLGKFYQDNLMKETLKAYLDANLNMVNAARKLYIHRNTLIQRLDKFYHGTGFDIRIFSDALIIYHLID